MEFHTKDINGDDYVTWQEYVDETYALNEQIDVIHFLIYLQFFNYSSQRRTGEQSAQRELLN